MPFTKVKSYNLALSALLLAKQVSDTETDLITNEVRVLNLFWDDALTSTLQEMDLDCLSEQIPLELIAELDPHEWQWHYAYKYPTRCAYLRRLKSHAHTDTSATFIEKRTGIYKGQKVIFTNHHQAVGECIPTDISLGMLSSHAGFAVSYKLAYLASPLLVGKGASKLRDEVYQSYLIELHEAQELDKNENFNYDRSYVRSEWVRERLS